MDILYYIIFGILSILVGGLLLSQNKEGSIVPTSGPNVQQFIKLRDNYVFVYALMMGTRKF
jgi:hypothetical protein